MVKTAKEPKAPKDKTGTLMRLLVYARDKQIEFDTRGRTLTQKKMLYALRNQIDKRIQEYFTEFPNERRAETGDRKNRLGFFMRNLREWRKLQDEYYTFGTKESLTRLWPFQMRLDADMDSYFSAHPTEVVPEKAKQASLLLQ